MINYDTRPMYYGTNRIRYENFANDLYQLMTDKSHKFSLTDALSYLIRKYELREAHIHNLRAYSFAFDTIYRYFKKYEQKMNKTTNAAEDAGDDLAAFRKFKKGS